MQGNGMVYYEFLGLSQNSDWLLVVISSVVSICVAEKFCNSFLSYLLMFGLGFSYRPRSRILECFARLVHVCNALLLPDG
jgi:hypothetical protein